MVQMIGHVDPKFEPVLHAFRANFKKRGEIGAGLSIWVKGKCVVDLCGGVTDQQTRRPWQPDTLMVGFSATKGIVAICFLLAHQEGLFDYDEPVTKYWPEFGENGKESITIRTLLNHRAGLFGLDTPISVDDLKNRRLSALESQKPAWSPGSEQGYHGITFGMYASELFLRITGQTLGNYVRNHLAEPYGLDIYLGLDASLDSRLATLYPATTVERIKKGLPNILFNRGYETRISRAIFNKHSDPSKAFRYPKELGMLAVKNYGNPEMLRTELAWGGGVFTASSLAKIYALLLGKVGSQGPLVKRELLKPVFQRQSWATADRILQKSMGWSQGFVKEEEHLFSPNKSSFGHPGMGGALGWADPTYDVAIGYVMNHMATEVRSPKALAICHALYQCLEGGFVGKPNPIEEN